jgi:hypothetical protein
MCRREKGKNLPTSCPDRQPNHRDASVLCALAICSPAVHKKIFGHLRCGKENITAVRAKKRSNHSAILTHFTFNVGIVDLFLILPVKKKNFFFLAGGAQIFYASTLMI